MLNRLKEAFTTAIVDYVVKGLLTVSLGAVLYFGVTYYIDHKLDAVKRQAIEKVKNIIPSEDVDVAKGIVTDKVQELRNRGLSYWESKKKDYQNKHKDN